MRHRIEYAREIEALYAEYYAEDPLTGRDANALEQDLRSHPHRAGVTMDNGYWVARRGRLAIIYDISDADLLVRVLAVKLCPHQHTLVRPLAYLDALQRVFDSVSRGTVIPEVDHLEAMIQRDPRRLGLRRADGVYEARLGHVVVEYSVSVRPPLVTLVDVRYEEVM